MKRARSVTSDNGGLDDDNRCGLFHTVILLKIDPAHIDLAHLDLAHLDLSRHQLVIIVTLLNSRSTASSQSVGPSRTPNRRTPSQVKAEAAARKAKVS